MFYINYLVVNRGKIYKGTGSANIKMSLDDRFNPNDGSLIDEIDGALLKIHKNIGGVWQNKTYKSKNEFARLLHGGSSGAFAADAAMGDYSAIILSLGVGAKSLGFFKHSTGLEQEIAFEALGLPKKTSKFIDVTFYGLGVLAIISGASSLIYGAVTRDGEALAYGTGLLSNGLGLVFWKTGDYLEKIDAGEPPKKPKKEPVLDRNKDRIGGILPQPIPVRIYSGIRDYVLAQPNK